MAHYRDRPLNVPLANLRNMPEDLWQAVLAVITTPPVSDFLAVGLSLSPQAPPLAGAGDSIVIADWRLRVAAVKPHSIADIHQMKAPCGNRSYHQMFDVSPKDGRR